MKFFKILIVYLLKLKSDTSEMHYDMDRVCTTLKQIARDWSDFGYEERKTCYDPIINDILAIYPENEWYIIN